MTELQRLLMNAYRDPQAVDQIGREYAGRLADMRSANYYGGTAPMSYGRMSLEEMIAKASGQETDKSLMGGIGRVMEQEIPVGGSVGIMDILREF